MKECCPDNLSIGNSVYQFEMTDSAQTVKLALNPLVRCGIEPGGIGEHRRVCHDLF